MKVLYTAPALTDLDSILEYIAQRSPQGPNGSWRGSDAVIALLPRYPTIGTPTERPGIRRIVVTPYPYLVFYEPTGTANHHPRDPAHRARPG